MGAHNVYRVIVHASGDIWIRTYPTAEERAVDSVQFGWITRDFDSADALEQILPMKANRVDRTKRHAWRWQGNRVVADASIPDPPLPRQALVDEATAATTVAQLKAVVLKLIRP